MPAAGEYQSAVNRFAPQNFGEDRWLRGAIDMEDTLLDAVDRRGGRRDGNLGRIAQHLSRELGDGARHRCGKQQRLPLRRELRDDFANVVDKAHIEHPVGFIEHEKFHLTETQRIALHEVEQAPGRGDEDVDAV